MLGRSPAASSSSSVKRRIDSDPAKVRPERGHVGCAGEAPRHADDRDGGYFAACRASVLHCYILH